MKDPSCVCIQSTFFVTQIQSEKIISILNFSQIRVQNLADFFYGDFGPCFMIFIWIIWIESKIKLMIDIESGGSDGINLVVARL